MNQYDPPSWDVLTTKLLGATLLRPFWAGWVHRLSLSPGESVLDFGSGSGQLSRRLALAVGSQGHLTCVDVSARWLAVARQTLDDLPWVRLYRGSPVDLPREVFDLVHVHYVLHALPRGERGTAIQDLAARLRVGGRLAVREPLYYGSLRASELWSLMERAGLLRVRGPERHWWLAGPVVEAVFRRPG